VAPAVVWAVLVTAGLSALASAVLAHRVGRALRQISAATQGLRRSTPADDLNLPLQSGSAELQRASASLRRLVEVWRRRQRELIVQTETLGRRLELRMHELSTLQDLSIGLASKTELHELVDEALGALEQTMAYTSASVWSRTRREEGGQVVLMGYRQNEGESDQLPTDDLTGMRLSRSNLQRYEHIEREGEPLIENRVRHSLLSWLWSWLSDDARTSGLYRGTKAWMAVPLKSRETVMGVLRVDHQEPDFFDAERVRLLTAVGSQTGLAMRHAQLLAQQKDQAVVAERNRIARDLHDAVSQTLFAANVIAGTLSRLAARVAEGEDGLNATALQEQAAALERLNKGALSEMRLLMYELRPDALQHLPLAELLQHALDALACRGTIEVSQRLTGEDRLPSKIRIHLYRIAQEALSNIARHSGAGHAVVEWIVSESGKGGRLRIADDGHGFTPGASPPGHFGLSNMVERAAEIGATWSLTSGPEEGTEIRLELTERE
jgi:signal transduction histidine kinase